MPFTLSQIIKPQLVANPAGAPLTLVTGVGSSASTGTVVPAQVQLSLWTCRFFNATGSPQTLAVWRVTPGGALSVQWQVVQVTIPVPTFSVPYFEWDPHYQMAPGDAIYAVAGSANAISVTGDGGITT